MSGEHDVAGRAQQSIAAGIILALGVWIAFVSFNVDDPQPYLFPQLISVVMVGLAAASLWRALRGANRTGAGMTYSAFQRIAPAIAIMLLYVFVLAPKLGYYLGATIAFFATYTLYDPQSHAKLKSWILRAAITAGFISILYVVFAMGLRVQTPRGVFL